MSMTSNVEVTARKHRSACASCLLDEIGVQEEDLSQGGRRTLGILAQVACVLNVDQVHMSEYLAVMDALSERHSNATDAVCTLEDEMKRITMRNDRTRQEMAHLAHMHESMRLMAEEREISENSGMFKHWARDNGEKERRYTQEIQHCHAELQARRFPLDESYDLGWHVYIVHKQTRSLCLGWNTIRWWRWQSSVPP
ncbi:hypothetical protein, variant [Aphanomyces astaci]|uniref:Uncharacterized protein n=1 Tax=Aphanomyces astaci TaxID=112090 RepID=W4G2F6_APHAT|nr:hypothetical protein, variant [Aphanomyces astaci]ETV73229.1 hypothetical protein, variant [Aphanomyces astaci]|eukprot:XP_009837433.1 hypothetical protein, variant [Aphanomyces astaci]